jgi:Gram-negative bacterial TonB protein C-terminal
MAQVVLSPIGQPICAWTCASTQGSREFAIHVPADVLARLAMEVRVAFKRVPRRGLEIGGILLGRADRRDETTTFWIEGFESVDSEHRSGPSYILSERDFTLLREALAKNGAASIGIFRSQTRSQQVEPQESDDDLFGRCFDGSDALFLMACPVAARAAFFVREGAELKCVYEFGLGSPLAHGGAVQSPDSPTPKPPDPNPPEMEDVVQPPPEIQTALVAVSRPIHAPETEDTANGSLLDRQRWLGPASEGRQGERAIDQGLGKPLSEWVRRVARFRKETWMAAAFIFAVVVGAGIGMLAHSSPPSPPPSVPAQRPAAKDLPLTVEGNGGLLRLHWDQNSSAIRDPARAVLHIQDGDYQMVRNLAPLEFNAGSVSYQPKSHDVTFRVDVSSPTASASGTVQVVNLSAPATAPVRPAQPLLTPSARYAAAELLPSKSPLARSEAAAAVPVAEKEEIRPSAVNSSNGSDTVSVIRRDASPAIEFDKEARPPVVERAGSPIAVAGPTVRVWPEAVVGSAWGRLVGKVPLLRRLRKAAKILTPAPIFQAQPVLTNPAKQSITGPVSVDVRVDVGESGVVENAELVEFSDPLNVALTNSALAAAVRWTFEPARSDDLAVPSKVILHFRFTP